MAPLIQDYAFGRIKIDGKTYTSDVLILPDGVRGNWWRKEGHSLAPEDIEEALEEAKPEALIIGTGASGMLTVPDSTRKWLEKKGVKLLEMPTRRACDEFNRLSKTKKVVAGLHLTC